MPPSMMNESYSYCNGEIGSNMTNLTDSNSIEIGGDIPAGLIFLCGILVGIMMCIFGIGAQISNEEYIRSEERKAEAETETEDDSPRPPAVAGGEWEELERAVEVVQSKNGQSKNGGGFGTRSKKKVQKVDDTLRMLDEDW